MTDIELAENIITAAGTIMQDIDNGDAYEFAESVQEKAQSMKDSIERYGHATSAMRGALENMLNGCNNWLENQR